jgi:hypothetical protein
MAVVLVVGLTAFLWLTRDGVSPAPGGAGEPDDEGTELTAEEIDRLSALAYVDFKPAEPSTAELSGVVKHDPDKAWPGFNLFSNRDGRAFLMDMTGKIAHTWSIVPHVMNAREMFCFHAELLRNADLALLCSSTGLFRLDRDSDLVFAFRGPLHHDVKELPDGRLLVLGWEAHPYKERSEVVFDNIVMLSPDGQFERVLWSSHTHLAQLRQHHGLSFVDGLMEREDAIEFWTRVGYAGERLQYHHVNSIEVVPPLTQGETDRPFRAGDLLLSARHVNNIFIIDQDTGKPVWSWQGEPELDWQHHPVMLPSGNILVFDNGTRREFSRVLELDPVNQAVVWMHEADERADFFTARGGDAQRLPNGNTLICESEKGRVFEITPEGEIVWEFWHPEITDGQKRKTIYRMERIGEDDPRIKALLGSKD